MHSVNPHRLRYSLLVVALLIYAVPFLFLSFLVGFGWVGEWGFTILSFLVAALGSIALVVKLWQWEGQLLGELDTLADSKVALTKSELTQAVPSEVISKQNQEQLKRLRDQCELLQQTQMDLEEELISTERDLKIKGEDNAQTKQQLDQLQQEFLFYQDASKSQLQQREMTINDYAQTTSELRASMEKKQQQISKLEGSIQDLNFELKTLIQVSDQEPTVSSPPPTQRPMPAFQGPVKSHNQASIQLKRCIDIAQKLTGASHVSLSSRFREVPIDSYALDQRRLFDNLRSETTGVVLVYSQREKKLLFANNEVKNLFGWSSEKLIHDFPNLVQEGYLEWQRAVASLAGTREAEVPLVIRTRSGHDQFVQCHLGIIPTGVFKNDVINVLYLP